MFGALPIVACNTVRNSWQWQIYIINSLDETRLSCFAPLSMQHCSFFKNLPPFFNLKFRELVFGLFVLVAFSFSFFSFWFRLMFSLLLFFSFFLYVFLAAIALLLVLAGHYALTSVKVGKVYIQHYFAL